MAALSALFALTSCVAATTASASAAALRPNIIWVMVDDLGWGEVELYPASSPHGRLFTPNLNQFGREGIVFRNAYAGYTVCAPSRTTFFTGRHSGEFLKYDLNGEWISSSDSVKNVATVLQDAGYTTGAVGKIAPLVHPLMQGFDFFLGQIQQGVCHDMYATAIDYGSGTHNVFLSGNDRTKSREDCMAHPELYNWTADVFQSASQHWLSSVAHGDRPFFLYLSYTIPHAGGWGDDSIETGQPVPSDLHYHLEPWPDVEKDHAASVTYLDVKVGQLMSQLKVLGIDDKTVVFFASDNGAHQEVGHSHKFFDSTGGLSGHKASLREGGVRSPTMVRWPGVIQPGQTSDFRWAFWDALPTFAELAGADGGDLPTAMTGMSIVPMLTGAAQATHKFLYWTWTGLNLDADMERTSRLTELDIPETIGYAVVLDNWKAIVPQCADLVNMRPSFNDVMRLYDLSTDHSEANDVAAHYPQVVDTIKALVVPEQFTCRCFQC